MTTQGPDPSGNPPAPFLSKCYDMVNDALTEATVSWSPAGDTFVVWDPPAFSRDLLPKYFKHGNFSSFVRQLNTYVRISSSVLFDDFFMLVNCLFLFFFLL